MRVPLLHGRSRGVGLALRRARKGEPRARRFATRPALRDPYVQLPPGGTPQVILERRPAAARSIADRAVVTLEPFELVDRALGRLRRRLDRAGVLRELKRREHYISPGEARRLKSRRARKRAAKTAERLARALTPRAAANEKPSS